MRVALGSLDRAGRLAQVRSLARVQVRSGFGTAAEVRADIYDALVDELKDPAEAGRRADELIAETHSSLVADAATWRGETEFDRLEAALRDLEAADIVVLRACEDHWAANEVLEQRAAEQQPPRGIAYFTRTDAWHAVEHHMLELNVWHADHANVAPGDELLAEVLELLATHRLPAVFDEGRIEVSVRWDRRP